MGRDKSQLVINGSTLAVRTAELLLSVVEIAVEVGPGVSGLVATREDPPGEGPLAAVAAGRRRLRELGHDDGGALVVACDLPLLSEPLLRLLAEWEWPYTVVPVVHGQPQPLCARWSARPRACPRVTQPRRAVPSPSRRRTWRRPARRINLGARRRRRGVLRRRQPRGSAPAGAGGTPRQRWPSRVRRS